LSRGQVSSKFVADKVNSLKSKFTKEQLKEHTDKLNLLKRTATSKIKGWQNKVPRPGANRRNSTSSVATIPQTASAAKYQRERNRAASEKKKISNIFKTRSKGLKNNVQRRTSTLKTQGQSLFKRAQQRKGSFKGFGAKKGKK